MYDNAKELGSLIYPSYYILRQAKEACYPLEDSISITEINAEIKLHSLLDHTVHRL